MRFLGCVCQGYVKRVKSAISRWRSPLGNLLTFFLVLSRPQLGRAMDMTSRIAGRTPHLPGSAASYQASLSDAHVALEVHQVGETSDNLTAT